MLLRLGRSLVYAGLLMLPAASSAQTGVGNDQGTPLPGGHDYIQGLSETVSPSNGQVNGAPQLVQDSLAVASPVGSRTLLTATDALGSVRLPQSVNGISLSGTIVYNWGHRDVSGTVDLTWDPRTGLSITSQTELGKRLNVITPTNQRFTNENGKTVTFGAHNSSRTILAYFPALELAGVAANSTAHITQLGTAQLSSGGGADAVSISGPWPSNDTDAAKQQVTFYLDPTTHLLVQRDDFVEFNERGSGRLPRRFIYSDFRPVDGVMFPFSISESLNDQLLYRITLSTIQIY